MDDELAALVRSLHDLLTASMTTVESLASECAEMAALAGQDGNQGMADVLRLLGRSHRIRALELAGRVSLLEEKYRNLLQPEA